MHTHSPMQTTAVKASYSRNRACCVLPGSCQWHPSRQDDSHCDLDKHLKIARALPACFPWVLMEKTTPIERDNSHTCI